jgi:hypothetical protein
VSENWVLRIFGSKREEVMGSWRKLQNEELRYLYSSPSIIRLIKSMMMKCTVHAARVRKSIRICIYDSGGTDKRKKRPPGRSRRSWDDSIKMDLRELG